MIDLTWALTVLLALSIVLFYFGARIASVPLVSNAVAILVTVFVIGFATQVHGRLLLARVVPLSNVIILGNCLPLAAALLAGILRGRQSREPWRKTVLAFALLAAGWLTVVWNTNPRHFPSANRFRSGVCLQSSSVTCGACSVVTLLHYHQIESKEDEMAEICLTNGRGTNLLGIYRGLKLKTEGTAYDVRVIQCSYDELRRLKSGPMVVSVRVLAEPTRSSSFQAAVAPPSDSAYRAKLDETLRGLLGRCDHCVVFFGFTKNNTVLVGDPSNHDSGLVQWSEDAFRRSWLGEGFCLERR